MNKSTAQAVLISVAMAAIVGLASLIGAPESVTRERPSESEPVVRSTSVCPYVGGEPRATSRIGVLALPGVAEPDAVPGIGDDEGEAVKVRALTAAGEKPPKKAPKPVLSVTERGSLAIETVDSDTPTGFAVRAEGALAPGVAAEQWMRATGPDLRGLVTATCTSPDREHWFVGAGAGDGQRGRLVLSNPSAVPAVVDLSLWTESGPLDAPGTKDVTIPPNGQEIRLLDALAPGAEQVAVRVRATRGRVSAGLDYRESDGTTPGGITAIPAAAEPATHVVVPGVPASGKRSLRILAPGDRDAIVSLRLLGPDGPFSPIDLDVLTVRAGTVLDVPIGAAVGKDTAAVELESDEPVTAAVRVVRAGPDELPDLAYTAAVETLPKVPVPALLGRGASGLTTRLLLTAVDSAGARVTVRTVTGDGDVSDEQTVDIKPNSTTVVKLEPPDGERWVTVVVQPAAAGSVVAVREMTGSDDDGRLVDLMPLVPTATVVDVPEVAGELPTGLRPAGRTEN